MKLPFLTSIVLLVAGSVNCSSQLLSEADIAKLAQECTNEYKKIQSVQAHGTRTKSGGMFAPPDPEFSRSTTRSAPSDNSVPNTFALYTAFKGEIVRHSEVRIEASQPKVDGKHSLERFNNYRPTNIYTSPKSFSSVGVLSTANAVSVSNRVRRGVSLLGMGFAVPNEMKWADELLRSGRYSSVGIVQDPKYGKLYECRGKLKDESSFRFWIAPDFSYRVMRSENKTQHQTITFRLDAVTKSGEIWVPKLATTTYAPSDGRAASHDVWAFETISLNDAKDSELTFTPKPGDQITDMETQQVYYLRANGEKFYPKVTQSDSASKFRLDWLYPASITTLLVLTVLAYIRWKRKQSAQAV